MRPLRSRGRTTLSWETCTKGNDSTYDVIELRYNYCIDETRSALAPVYFKRLTSTNARRMNISKKYREALLDAGVVLPFRDVPGAPA